MDVALDEALLHWAAEQPAGGEREVLRLWESPTIAVVIGRSTKLADEVHADRCAEAGIPILRRCSGGAAVVIGPGCLMYAVVLDLQRSPHLEMINAAHEHVTSQLAAAVRRTDVPVEIRGHCDLTLDGRKVSGNALRVTKSHVLYHGTLLYQFPLQRISDYLREPPRQPEYRERRTHDDFVRNLDVDSADLKSALARQWGADQELVDWPRALTEQLFQSRYRRDDWNFRR